MEIILIAKKSPLFTPFVGIKMPAETPILIWIFVFSEILMVFLRVILLPLKMTVNAREEMGEVEEEEEKEEEEGEEEEEEEKEEEEKEDEEEEEEEEKEDEEEEEEEKGEEEIVIEYWDANKVTAALETTSVISPSTSFKFKSFDGNTKTIESPRNISFPTVNDNNTPLTAPTSGFMYRT